MENFMYGTSSIYGSLICKPSQLTEVKEEIFFNMIKNSLKECKLEKFTSDAMKKTNLKKGVTIGNHFFIVTNGIN